MSTLPLILIVISALMHAGWNSIGKRSATSASFYVWATAAGAIIYSPLLIPHWQEIAELPMSFWHLLFWSGGFQALYLTGLAKAYRSADLSLVYPLARALPVLIVPVIVLAAYGQSILTPTDIVAMALITIGAIVLPLSRWRAWRLDAYLNAGVGWALMAALGTAGYSIIDSAAIQIMRTAGWDAFAGGSTFVVLQAASIILWMLPVLKWGVKEPLIIPMEKRLILLTGLFLVGTYLLVLVSMSLVEEVSYVVALRQLSIPIGVSIGVLWLGEKLTLPRIHGVCLMLTGLVIIAI